VIVLDTHIWLWWVQDEKRLSHAQRQMLELNEATGLGVSVISCWEIGMLVAKGRLVVADPVGQWVRQALRYPGIRQLRLTPTIAVDSTRLPGEFHPDPADSDDRRDGSRT